MGVFHNYFVSDDKARATEGLIDGNFEVTGKATHGLLNRLFLEIQTLPQTSVIKVAFTAYAS